MNLYEYLLPGKARDAIALVTAEHQYSYGDLERAVQRVATLLVDSGGKKGDRAVLVVKSGFFWVAAYLGILRAGLVCVPLPPRTSRSELDHVLTTTEALYSCVDNQFAFASKDLLRATTVFTEEEIVFPSGDGEQSGSDRGLVESDHTSGCNTAHDDDLAALMFTSGSTGKPRGVMVSHRNIIANTESIVEYMRLTSSDRVMAVLPFDYCFGTSLLHTHLRVGGSIVIDSRFMYPQAILRRMSETKCTGFAGVPSHFQILLRRSRLASTDLPHLRYVQQAGGQLALTFIAELRNALPDKQIFIMYGQTEGTARLSYLPPEFLDAKPGSIGKGIPGVRLHVLDESGEPVKAGETGEIVAEGANIAGGYWRDQEESAKTFRDGRLHTGDLGTVDADGFIYILDRAKDFLKCGGKRISCRTLENALLEHPNLLEVAVVGVPDDVLGEAAVAYVVAQDPTKAPSIEELISHCKKRLSPVFVPKQIVFVRGLPKNSGGKVLKAKLKANPPEALNLNTAWPGVQREAR